MASKLLTVVWVVAAAVAIVMAPAARLMRGTERQWAEAALAGAIFFGLLLTLVIGRVTQGRWLADKEAGAPARGRYLLASFLVVSGYFTLRPLLGLPPW